MQDPKLLGLINALLANRADTPPPARPRTLSSLSQGLFGLGGRLGALSSIPTPPRVRGALEQVFAKSEHDRLVEKLRNRLVANLYSDIKVDLPGYEKPTRIVWTATQRGHEPDASAYYLLKQHIFEVETADSIGDEHTYEQCRLFAAYAQQHSAKFPGGHLKLLHLWPGQIPPPWPGRDEPTLVGCGGFGKHVAGARVFHGAARVAPATHTSARRGGKLDS